MKKVKIRKSLATNVILIFLIFNVFSILSFTYYVGAKEGSAALEYAKESMREIVREKSELIAVRFERIETQVQLLGIWTEKLLAKGGYGNALSQEYVFKDDGTIVRKRDETKDLADQSNIIVANTTEQNQALMEEINLTEELDEPFARILKNEDVTWAYIATKDNLLRCSPYQNLSSFFDSNHSQSKDVFYTMANAENNPERKPVWTKPYTDYLGTGWTMTCSQPIYDEEDELYGVICLDLAVENIKEKYFESFSLGETGKGYWLDQEGNIFYHTDYNDIAENQGQVYEKNLFEEESMSAEKEAALKQALSSDEGMELFMDDGTQKIIVYSKVSGTDSSLIIEMDMRELEAGTAFDLEKAAVLTVIDLFLACLFGVLLYFKFSRPMGRLTRSADKISEGDYSFINGTEIDEDYYEIAQLNRAFRTMNHSIEQYTETLLEKNREISTIIETIEGTLMIVDMDGNVKLQSKDTQGIPKDHLMAAIDKIKTDQQVYTQQEVVEGEVYKNTYYPLFKGDKCADEIVVSSECITKSILMEKELQQLEKMAGVGQLSAAIVHELKNILALIKGAAYILNITEGAGAQKEIQTIMKAVEEAENVITTLLDFSRRDSNGWEMVHVGTLVHQILLLSKKETIRKNIHIHLDLDEMCYIYSNGREALKVILQNIIINAIQAVECGGEIKIKCRREQETAQIEIRDNGGGIEIRPVERIFEPFVTTKEMGTGIGLWITKRLVDTLEGDIRVDTEKPGETAFLLSIPTNRGE